MTPTILTTQEKLSHLAFVLMEGCSCSSASSSAQAIVVEGLGFSSIREATVHDIQLAFKQNQLTSRKLVEFYLKEIERLNPVLKGVLEVNPDALHLADQADHERNAKAPGSLSMLHGVPILVKDNIATRDKLNTTAGSCALLGSVVPRDAGVVTKLREAGAIILGKASLSEWSHYRSNGAPSGWNARNGQGKNPYTMGGPCGSSSGPAISVAANMAAVSLGTETDGSILCPCSCNLVVGIKPTVGLTSRAGVIPISQRQDTVGERGAILVDNLKIANLGEIYSSSYEETALVAEFKICINSYLKELVDSPVRSLADLIAFNKENSELERLDYGQDLFLKAEATNGIGNAEKEALANLAKLTREGFVELMTKNKLDALVTPGNSVSCVLAIGGFPVVIVPAGYDSKEKPFGLCFGGLKGSEPKLIEIAYSFEQATEIRKPPKV
ncbi:hypothetical protein RGQ29_004998 [Quercus rubra]|uniref:Amidase domain-containing protein n=1 Tax=Quercus rubra TaxID=3512 RepID=A0AAN7E366_QUERU|nr:hypothetical protein RGQ29_004998 [Quercus rubra]